MKLSAGSGPTSDISGIVIGTVSVDPPSIIAGSMADVTATFHRSGRGLELDGLLLPDD